MKVPIPRKLSSGTYFIQLRLGGVSVPVSATTAKACTRAAQLVKAEYAAGKRSVCAADITLGQAIDKYISSRRNVLSPSTIRGYTSMRRNRFAGIMDTNIAKIKDWQSVVNAEAATCSPKTLKNAWGMIVPVLKAEKLPVPSVSMPQVPPADRPYLDPDEIPVFVSAVRGTDCEIAALLALHSLRRSEICALDWKNVDLKRNRIKVSGALVADEHSAFVQKDTNKNASSARYIPIMIPALSDALASVKDKTGLVVPVHPNTVFRRINRVCAAAGLPLVGVHGLRHSFASLAYHLNMPEKIAMQIGGWSDSDTMHKIYTHIAAKDVTKYENAVSQFFSQSC